MATKIVHGSSWEEVVFPKPKTPEQRISDKILNEKLEEVGKVLERSRKK